MGDRDNDREGRARLVLHEKVIDEEGGITELVIWQVPRSANFPEGVRYRLAYVPPATHQPAVLYDVHRRKSHHRHFLGHESPYAFRGVRQLIEDFRADVQHVKARRGDADEGV